MAPSAPTSNDASAVQAPSAMFDRPVTSSPGRMPDRRIFNGTSTMALGGEISKRGDPFTKNPFNQLHANSMPSTNFDRIPRAGTIVGHRFLDGLRHPICSAPQFTCWRAWQVSECMVPGQLELTLVANEL